MHCALEQAVSSFGSETREVWDKATFKLKTTLRGHTASVLALEYAPEEKWLFSASGMCATRTY